MKKPPFRIGSVEKEETEVVRIFGRSGGQVRAKVSQIDDDSGKEGVDDSKDHDEMCFGLGVLFEELRPVAGGFAVFRTDPDAGDFELETENDDGGYEADAGENFRERVGTRFVFLFLVGLDGGVLGCRGSRGSERFGWRIERDSCLGQ